ncbi:MAG: polymer-forming cytoskeletal protein [Tabrizicola sp.]|uniref:bactofilin family protein n=1 Tax=Tabrizicola sp. TaxID=2005166 RepID=UPI002732917E|nr:polymer-forming cytoskeletal protein [Tabrizicola sp.]MDP3262696.1 polymer-forming cytoskeletal protein [Tabrizicola sp.]MDP3648892.1 polymer-forming cytoskeletal protein [Paracoccaceae bacterium]
MFSKTADPTSAPPAPPRPSTGGTNSARSVLGADLRITGEITSTGLVEVLGEIDGNISAQGLIIGQEGRVTGSVRADTVEVKGRFDGKVSCHAFTLRSTASVTADVTTATVVIESGATIEGRFLKTKG